MRKVTALGVLVLVGCIGPRPKLAELAPPGSPIPADSVRIVSSVGQECTALVQMEEPAGNREKAMADLRAKAGAHGANAVVLGQVHEKTTTGNKILWGGFAPSSDVIEATGYRCPKGSGSFR